MRRGKAVTTEQAERALNGLRFGMTRRAAAAVAGFDRTTLYRMIERDATFATAVQNAEGEAEAMYVSKVAVAADDPKNWTAAAWWLERRHPDDFGRRDRVEVTVDIRKLAESVADGMDPDELVAEAERIVQGAR